MSRKIVQHSGFENVLKSTAKNPDFFKLFVNESDPTANYFSNVFQHLANCDDKRLYWGAGLIIGGVVRNKRVRKIAAPLLTCLVDLEWVSESKSVLHEHNWDSLTLNNDLITLILDKDDVLDEENSFTDYDKLNDVFQRIESDFEELIASDMINRVIKDKTKLYDIIMRIQVNNPEFNIVKLIPFNQPFPLSQKDNFLKEKNAVRMYFEYFYFVASYPHELSTYIAINELIKQVK
ncbi:MAG: hypothetical protein Q8916_08455 [Bacteroidota bacterium]|nr:hypothetical protein [Bacteroidota bacterium]